jgi:hypothetical protein
MWFDFGAPGVIEKILGETGFLDVKTSRLTISMEVASPQAYWEAVLGISGRLQMLVQNISPDAAQRIQDSALSAAEHFRYGAVIRIPCEEIIATARIS